MAVADTVWMTATFSTPESGWIIAEQAETGTTADLYGHNDPWTCTADFGGNPHDGGSALGGDVACQAKLRAA